MIKNLYVITITFLMINQIYKFLVVLNEKKYKNNLVTIILILLFSIIYNTLYIKKPAEIYSFLPLIFIFVLLKINLKIKLKTCLFYMIIVWFIGLGMDMIIMLCVSQLNNIFLFEESNLEIIQIMSSIIILITYYVFSKSIKIIKTIKELHKKFLKVKASYFAISILLIFYFIIAISSLNKINNKDIIFMNIIIINTFLLLVITIIIKNYQIKMLKETRELLIKNNEFYIKLIDDYRIMKHNLVNKLLGIKTVSNLKTKNLIDDLILEYNSSFKTIKDIKNIPVGINGIIYEKIYNTENNYNLNIYIENNIKSDLIHIITSKEYNQLCEALGVIVDNAIEASLKSKDKILYINLLEDREFITIKVKNSFNGCIDFEKIGNLNYSTKGSNHGLGLASIFRKKEVVLKTNIKQKIFSVSIILKKNKD